MTSDDREVRIYTKVVADLFHHGHIRFFKAARELGTHLTVGVVPDDRVAAYKGKTPVFSLSERLEIVSACRWVDQVTSNGPKLITKSFMEENNFHIYAFGAFNDQEYSTKLNDCPDLPETMRSVIPYTPGISSTIIRERIAGLGRP
jgi:cytidyltransferase-like protein